MDRRSFFGLLAGLPFVSKPAEGNGSCYLMGKEITVDIESDRERLDRLLAELKSSGVNVRLELTKVGPERSSVSDVLEWSVAETPNSFEPETSSA